MDDEKKRSLNRERVKRHRAVKADLDEILKKRSRHQIRQCEPQSSTQNSNSVNLESSNSDENQLLERELWVEDELSEAHDEAEVVTTANRSAEIDDEHETSDQRIQIPVYEDADVGFRIEDDRIELSEQSPVSQDIEEQEVARHDVEIAVDEGQGEARRFEEVNSEEIEEITQIRDWAVENHVRQNKLDQLLTILRRRLLPTLPKSSKTFLKTAEAHYDIKEMESADESIGQYVYFGIAQGILASVRENLHEDKTFHLQFNVDGIPLFNSSTKQFWPILCKVHFTPDIYEPFVVAIYCGDAKPKHVNDFLADFVCEINQLLLEGITITAVDYKVKIHSFICDTPARAFLKCTKGSGGYWACERCETRGQRVEKRTVYPEINCRRRTDRSFRNETQRPHHKGRSPLLEIRPHFGLVSQFVLDSMHLCCIGIMKKLAEYWIIGKNQSRMQRRNKLGSQQQKELSKRMDHLKRCIPAEFQRKPRGVNRIAMWKATEFRFFLLYCGPIVLRGILNPDLYKHFLLLHTACRILCSEDLAFEFNSHAKKYLRTFFTLMSVYYGRQSQILNAHNLVHIADDVIRMGCTLSKISAFPFESLLGKIKMHLRNANRPLAQVCRRLHEWRLMKKKAPIPQAIEILTYTTRREGERIEISKIKYKGFILTIKEPNNLVILDDDLILTVTKMTCIEGNPRSTKIEGHEWKIKSSIFKYPTASKTLKMWRLQNQPAARIVRCNINKVYRKMVRLEIIGNTQREERKYYAVPFLHS